MQPFMQIIKDDPYQDPDPAASHRALCRRECQATGADGYSERSGRLSYPHCP
jgi:hypothetical protein